MNEAAKEDEIRDRFLKACWYGDLENAQQALKEGVAHNFIHHGFYDAVKKGQLKIVEYLATSEDTAHIIDIHWKEAWAAHSAAIHGNIKTLKFFLSSPKLKTNIDVNTNKGALLTLACKYHHQEMIDYLLFSSELKENADPSQNGGEAIWVAMWNSNRELMFKLLGVAPQMLKAHDQRLLRHAVSQQNDPLIGKVIALYGDQDTDYIDILLKSVHLESLSDILPTLSELKKDAITDAITRKSLMKKSSHYQKYPVITTHISKKELLRGISTTPLNDKTVRPKVKI